MAGRFNAMRLSRYAAALALLVLSMIAAPPALAAKMMFGATDYLKKIQDVAIKGPKGETLYLGYKFSHHAFILPYMLADDGYILGIDDGKSYYKLSAEQIERYQRSGALPNPLPPYEIGFFDYVFGYLGWIILAGLVAWFGIAKLGERKQKAALPVVRSGDAHAAAGNFDAAIADYDRALAMAPKFVEVLVSRGNARWNKGDLDGALGDYSKAIAGNSKHADALYRRGLIFCSKSLFAQGIADFSRALKSADNANVRHARAMAYANAGDFKNAIADFTAVLKVAPHADNVLLQRADAYEKSGQPAKAAADRQAAAESKARQAMAG